MILFSVITHLLHHPPSPTAFLTVSGLGKSKEIHDMTFNVPQTNKIVLRRLSQLGSKLNWNV